MIELAEVPVVEQVKFLTISWKLLMSLENSCVPERKIQRESLNLQAIGIETGNLQLETEDNLNITKRLRRENSGAENNTMLSKISITSVKTTTSFSVKTFVKEFLSSDSLLSACSKNDASKYVTALSRLCDVAANDLAITKTEYSFESKRNVKIFDIKCRHRIEDDYIEKIYRDWAKNNAATYGKICPFRRGMCIGLIDDKTLILAMGNCKFFYGEENDILNAAGKEQEGIILLTEKANGEYTLLSSCIHENERWLTFGSKNVRITLPYFEDNPDQTKEAFFNFLRKFNKNEETAEEGGRYSYLADMIPLWLSALTSRVFRELDIGTTLVGEQVGVHAHIFTGYNAPHIRLFASLPHSTLTESFGCNLIDLYARLFDKKFDDDLRMRALQELIHVYARNVLFLSL